MGDPQKMDDLAGVLPVWEPLILAPFGSNWKNNKMTRWIQNDIFILDDDDDDEDDEDEDDA